MILILLCKFMNTLSNLRTFYFHEIKQIDTVNQDNQEYMKPMLIMDILEISCHTVIRFLLGFVLLDL